MSLPERCTIETAELILGLKRRNIQAMAARGEIPGALSSAISGRSMSRSYGGTLQRGSSNAPESADRMLLAWRYPLGSHLYQRPRDQAIATDKRPEGCGTTAKVSARARDRRQVR